MEEQMYGYRGSGKGRPWALGVVNSRREAQKFIPLEKRLAYVLVPGRLLVPLCEILHTILVNMNVPQSSKSQLNHQVAHRAPAPIFSVLVTRPPPPFTH